MASPSTPAKHTPPFVVRIVSIDYYMAAPLPGVDVNFNSVEGTRIEQVPVIRIFGSTPAGQKACLHVHQVGQSMTYSAVNLRFSAWPGCAHITRTPCMLSGAHACVVGKRTGSHACVHA